MPQQLVREDLTPRLEAAAAAVADAKVELALAIEHRDALVVEAADEGMTQKRIASAIGCGQPHIIRILAASERDAVLPRA